MRSVEQRRYSRMIEHAVNHPGQPMIVGGFPGLGKTQGYLTPLIQSGKRVAICLPTRFLIQQLLSSDSLKRSLQGHEGVEIFELKSKRHFESDVLWQQHKKQAHQAQIMVCTHAAAIIDALAPGYANLREREVVLFDEAELLADAADLRATFMLPRMLLESYRVDLHEYEKAARTVLQKCKNHDFQAAAKAILKALECPAWYQSVGKDGQGNLILKHRSPGRLLAPLINEIPRVIFTGGTVFVNGTAQFFAQAIGLKDMDAFSLHFEPVDVHGRLSIFTAKEPLALKDKAPIIQQAPRPCLVLTPSHREANELGSLIPDAIVRASDEHLMDALHRTPDDGILIAAGAFAGMDVPRLRWTSVVISTVPYGQPVLLDNKYATHYLDSRMTAVRRIYQGLHRGLRTPDASCNLYLLDPRILRPDLRCAIPVRFKFPGQSI